MHGVRFVTIAAALAANVALSADAPAVPYPDGYRRCVHVKSMVI